MNRLGHFAAGIPLTIKVPVLVVLLMLTIGAVVSEGVLSRLVSSQERQLGDLASAYLDGLASPLVDPILRGDPWEIFDILDQSKRVYAAVTPVETVVTNPTGVVLASSNPRDAGIGGRLPSVFPATGSHGAKALIDEAHARAFIDRTLVVQGRQIATLHAELDISPLLAERQQVLLTLIASNAALTLGLAALGWFAVRRMVAPMKVLTDHLESAKDGAVEPIEEGLIPSGDTETGRLFRRFNRMAVAVTEREALASRLADEERLASLGRLASGMAHEINNPLGGLFNALDTLKTHGEKAHARMAAIALLDRGLRGIRDVVRTALAAYRPDRETRDLQAADIEDLRLLVRPEASRKQITLEWRNDLPPAAAVVAFPVRQIVLNLLLNACRAAPENGRVALAAGLANGALVIDVEDSGPGMPPFVAAFLDDATSAAPITTGLGLWMARRMAAELHGSLIADRSALGGARVRLTLPERTGALSDVA